MAPLRSVLSSRAVIVGLALLGAVGLFVSTMDTPDGYNFKSVKDRYNNPNRGNDPADQNVHLQGPSNIQWRDAGQPDLTGQPLSKNPGRRPKTVQKVIEDAKGFYQRIVKQRHENLAANHYGTTSFDPWFVLMYWWWYFPPSFVCPHDIQRVGPLSDGGKWICGMSLYEEKPRSKCVLYSFGVNHETRFEGEMLDRTDCEIWAYDASVSEMGPETQGRPHVTFKPYFIGREDKVAADGKIWKTLRTLMKENGHDWIDILKVDIEGSEYDTFAAIMDDFPDVLPFSQLQLELHVHQSHVSFPDFLNFWERLESKGVYPWWTEINLNPVFNPGEKPWASEYCFINIRGGAKNLLIQNYE
ncbi:hypothetical protein CPC16_010694 [Podila verticillata]|nr:hypothetical protein BGZ59_003500 [Podila verticillata]KAF9379560.1 hypothetical protein CPC16_010694 [Podila verticillata]KAI9233176.1 MAG: methyltransferase domain-containing protein [Podila humilis]KFH67748.1 hypothetical protein MVEG_06480 [Podila verticillata NRRL 6337]